MLLSEHACCTSISKNPSGNKVWAQSRRDGPGKVSQEFLTEGRSPLKIRFRWVCRLFGVHQQVPEGGGIVLSGSVAGRRA